MNIHKTAIDAMREMVAAFDRCNETFNQQFTLPQLVKIWNAWNQCGWTIPPDEWTSQQVREALRGIAPDWDAQERPVFDAHRAETRRVKQELGPALRRSK